MDVSIFLAKVIGIYVTATTLSFFVNKRTFALVFRLSDTPEEIYVSGIINLLVGAIIVSLHNVWVSDWRLLITFVGWTALVKGAIRIFWPSLVVAELKDLKKVPWLGWLILVALAMGLYLLYVGFVVV